MRDARQCLTLSVPVKSALRRHLIYLFFSLPIENSYQEMHTGASQIKWYGLATRALQFSIQEWTNGGWSIVGHAPQASWMYAWNFQICSGDAKKRRMACPWTVLAPDLIKAPHLAVQFLERNVWWIGGLRCNTYVLTYFFRTIRREAPSDAALETQSNVLNH